MSNNQLIESDEARYIPKLRFTEFQDSQKWKFKTIGDFVASHIGGASLTPSDFVKFSNYEVLPKKAVTNSKWLQTNNIESTYCTQVFFEKNQKNIVDSSYLITTLRDLVPSGPSIGFIARYSGDKKYLLAQGVYGLKLNNLLVPDFLIFYSQTGAYRKLVQSVMVGSTQVHIRNSVFLNLSIPVPPLPEQAKIAACLSSVDELIQNESSKLNTYKQHKDGLLQQLFPKNGESLPSLRFDEFCEEWNLNAFSNYIKLNRGSSPRPISEYLTKDEEGINWIKIGDTKNSINSIIYNVAEKITKQGAKKSRSVKKGELILANSMSYGKAYELAIDGCIYDGWFVLRDFEKYFYKPFLLQLLNSDYMQQQYQRLAAGGIVQNISSDIVYKSLLPHTLLEEQKKLAECLCSLDNLITYQSNYIEQLKQHKKGLMQQLFPVLEDVSV